MTIKFELDCLDLANAASGVPLLQALDLFGPQERIMGSTDHVFRRSPDGVILHIQNFKVTAPYVYSIVRRKTVSIQFITRGSYRLAANGWTLRRHAGTININGFKRSASTVLPNPHPLTGVCLFVERQQLVDAFGLKVDGLPETYRQTFVSQTDAEVSIELPLPPSAWAAVDEIVRCRFPEPLRAAYLNARSVELLCLTVAELNKLRRGDRPTGLSAESRQRVKIEMAEAIYRREIASPPSLDEVSRQVGLNRNKLVAGFKERFSVTPYDYSRQIRLRRAHEMLLSGALTVQQIAMSCGYSNHAAFTRSFREEFGYTPSETNYPLGEDAGANMMSQGEAWQPDRLIPVAAAE
jgi:AraC family transcriptional regulator, transcriptional activator of the genes for pyochelin and ferripyochelin receptors